MNPFPARGLYAITQCENKFPDDIIRDVKAAIRGGAAVIQYRDKTSTDKLFIACELAHTCRQYNVPLIINDDVELAIQAKADGVHLGKDDGEITEARKRLRNGAIIGVSCYNSLERAMTAELLGATYVAFGRFFPSNSKPLAAPADIGTLIKAKQAIRLPIAVIGGILPENGAQLLAAGAGLLAAIGGVFDNDPEHSARAYQHLFER